MQIGCASISNGGNSMQSMSNGQECSPQSMLQPPRWQITGAPFGAEGHPDVASHTRPQNA